MAGDAASTAEAAVRDMQQSAAGLMQELSDLTAKLREAGRTVGDKADAGADALQKQLEDLQARIKALTSDSETIAKLDKSVRANPYLYILGALGVGLLLGKILRS